MADAERQMQEMLAHGENLQMEARALDEQRQMLEQLSRDLRRGRDTMEALRAAQPGEEILLPVGGGTFVKAQLSDSSKVLSNLGAGVVLESSVPEAIARLEERLTTTETALERTTAEFHRIEQELGRINAALSRFSG